MIIQTDIWNHYRQTSCQNCFQEPLSIAMIATHNWRKHPHQVSNIYLDNQVVVSDAVVQRSLTFSSIVV